MTTLNIKIFGVLGNNSPPSLYFSVIWQAADIDGHPYAVATTNVGPLDVGTNTFPDIDSVISHYNTSCCTTVLNSVNSFLGTTYYTDYTTELVDTPVTNLFNELATVAKTGEYSDLLSPPSLATVATSGNYNDLTGKPSIPAAQVNADWAASAGISQILNKPSLSTVATTGAYHDLTGVPTLAMVATSGAYSDLTGKPTIPAAQVQSDWNATSGVSSIANKPTLATVATSGAYADLTGKPSIPTVPSNVSAFTNDSGYITTSGARNAIAVTGNGSYNSSTGVITVNSPSTPSFGTPSRTVGTSFQISSTRNAIVNYTIPVTSAAVILTGSQASATLKYADDSGITTNVVTVNLDQFGAASGLVVTALGSLKLSGIIPAGKYAIISTSNLAGTPTYGSISAQEVLL